MSRPKHAAPARAKLIPVTPAEVQERLAEAFPDVTPAQLAAVQDLAFRHAAWWVRQVLEGNRVTVSGEPVWPAGDVA